MVDHQTISLCFGNALGFLLQENEGIICQGELQNNEIQKFFVWRSNEKIHVAKYDGEKEIGQKIWMYETKEDAFLAAAIDGGEFDIE